MSTQKKILLPLPERILEYVNEFAAKQLKRGEKIDLTLPSYKTMARAVVDQDKVFVVDEGDADDAE